MLKCEAQGQDIFERDVWRRKEVSVSRASVNFHGRCVVVSALKRIRAMCTYSTTVPVLRYMYHTALHTLRRKIVSLSLPLVIGSRRRRLCCFPFGRNGAAAACIYSHVRIFCQVSARDLIHFLTFPSLKSSSPSQFSHGFGGQVKQS